MEYLLVIGFFVVVGLAIKSINDEGVSKGMGQIALLTILLIPFFTLSQLLKDYK